MEFFGVIAGIAVILMVMSAFDTARDKDIKHIKQQLKDIKSLLSNRL